MKKFFRAVLWVCFLFLSLDSRATDSANVRFDINTVQLSETEKVLTIKATALPGIKLYGLQQSADDVLYSSVSFDSAFNNYLSGVVEETGNKNTEKDLSVDANVSYYSDSVLWRQKISIKSTDSMVLKGVINYLYKKGDEYLPGERPFKINLGHGTIVRNATSGMSDRSLLWIFLSAFAGGLLALLTPCVYSMIPVTVSFFTKRSNTKAQGIRNALYYALSIVIIFTLLGFLVTLIFGPAALNNLATHWVANLVFFALFLLFGISFLGAFEITLPSSWSNRADSKAGTGNFFGIFFMALTLAVVSFSCTGPIIGNLLVLAAKGSYWGPLTGMFGFSLET